MEKELLAKIAALAGFINNQKRIAAKSIPPSHSLSFRKQERRQQWKSPQYYKKPNYGSDFVKKGKNKLIRKQPTDYVKRGKNKLVRTEIIKAHLFAPKKNISKISTRKFVNIRHLQNKYIPRRMTINGITFEKSTNGKSLVRSKNERTKQIASQKVKDSIKTLQGKKKTAQYCIFFTKFGKCKDIEKCKYVHDPNKKAICRYFLKGECHNNECLLLHKIDSEKMPVCSYFLRGVCTNDNCPYSHVNVNPKAAICEDFKKGYCPLGDKCKLKHILKRSISNSSSIITNTTTDATTTNNDAPVTSVNISYPLSIRPVFSSSVLNKT